MQLLIDKIAFFVSAEFFLCLVGRLSDRVRRGVIVGWLGGDRFYDPGNVANSLPEKRERDSFLLHHQDWGDFDARIDRTISGPFFPT